MQCLEFFTDNLFFTSLNIIISLFLAASVQINIISSTDGGIKFPPPWTSENPEFVITVPEESPEQSVITQVTATDPQTGNQITDYREVAGSDPGNYFIVEQNTGKIKHFFLSMCMLEKRSKI